MIIGIAIANDAIKKAGNKNFMVKSTIKYIYNIYATLSRIQNYSFLKNI
jgi:hypothetical protein